MNISHKNMIRIKVLVLFSDHQINYGCAFMRWWLCWWYVWLLIQSLHCLHCWTCGYPFILLAVYEVQRSLSTNLNGSWS